MALIGAKKIARPAMKVSSEAAEETIFHLSDGSVRNLLDVQQAQSHSRDHDPTCDNGGEDYASPDVDILGKQAHRVVAK